MKEFLIVAHGSPSRPDPAEAAVQALAGRVASLWPEVRVGAATLAKPGSLAQAVQAFPQAQVYPFFMAEGWFTRTRLPRQLAELGAPARILPPFGSDPALPGLVASVIGAAGPGDVILVAHGSKRSRSSQERSQSLVRQLAPLLPERRLALAFLEEPPHLREVAATCPDALCLPLFVLRAGHVDQDVPEALKAAAFRGKLLPAIGEQDAVAGLIAAALHRN
jgi:sirohydrochlorin ferrochelatase